MEVALAVIAVIGTLSGLIVGSVLDRGLEGRQWVRDHRAASYDRYVERFQQMRQILRELAIAHRDSERWEVAREGRREAWKHYNFALVQVELYGSPAAYSATLDVDSALRSLSEAVSPAQVTVSDWQALREPMDAALRICIDHYRTEFRLPKLGDRSAWVASNSSAMDPQDLGDLKVTGRNRSRGRPKRVR